MTAGSPARCKLYSRGLSLRATGRLLGTTAQSVLRGVRGYADAFCPKPVPGVAPVVEIDGMWHYVGCKANKLWIWKAIDRATGRLIDWQCGDRSEAAAGALLERLRAWSVRLFCTDSYVSYENLKTLPKRIGAKRLSFASGDLLLETLGIQPGAVSPFALLNDTGRRVRLVLDAGMLREPRLTFHPLCNTATMSVRTEDFLALLAAYGIEPLVINFGTPIADAAAA